MSALKFDSRVEFRSICFKARVASPPLVEFRIRRYTLSSVQDACQR